MKRLAVVMVVAECAVLLSFVLPEYPLDGYIVWVAYWLAESGGSHFLPILIVALLLVHLSRSAIPAQRRSREVVAIVSVASLFLGGGAYLNEHHVKRQFRVARPNVRELARQGTLTIGADAFYALGGKAERSAYLEKRLSSDSYSGPHLPDYLRDHWSKETGYSFPSGHAFSALLFVTFFLALRTRFGQGGTRWPDYLLLLWALGVCYSRVILRVHSPVDVSVGALQGIVLGGLAYVAVAWLLDVTGVRSETTE